MPIVVVIVLPMVEENDAQSTNVKEVFRPKVCATVMGVESGAVLKIVIKQLEKGAHVCGIVTHNTANSCTL